MRGSLLAGLVLILLLATFLRFHRLEAQSFWNDEGNSARLSERPVALIIKGTAGDVHPPLYYLLLRGWRELAGDSEFSLRAPSAFAGLATVAVTFTLAQAVAGRRSSIAALATVLLAAVNPALVYYSQEARMYALLGLLAALATLLLVRWRQALRAGATRSARLVAAAYVLSAAAGLYTHYFFPAVLLSHNLLVLIWLVRASRHHKKHPRTRSPKQPQVAQPVVAHPRTRAPVHLLFSWTAIMIVTLLLYLPWLPIFLAQFGSEPVRRPSFWHFLVDAGRWLAFGATVEPATLFWPLLAAGLLLLWGAVANGRRALVGLVTLIIPVLLMVAAGLAQPEFYKFLVVAVPPFCLLLALPLAPGTVAARWQARPFLSLLLLIVLVASGRSLHNMYTNPAYARADYRYMAARIIAEAHPNAGVILNAPNQWEVFTYYYLDERAVYPLPGGRQPPDPAVIDGQLAEIATRHDRLYAIFWGEAQRDPQRLVERWLDAHAFKATDEWIGDVRFVTYAVPAEPALAMETAADLRFGEHIYLQGYTLQTDEAAAGDIVQVTLFWQTAALLSQRYKVFLHLVDGAGQVIAQRDSEPGGGLMLTTTWQPGRTLADNHGILLPAATAPGDYRLLLGLYDFADPATRLSIYTSDDVVDAIPLATIHVSP